MPVEQKLEIVLSVLSREVSVADAARRHGVSDTSVANWRDQFVAAGRAGLEAGGTRGPSSREAELERRISELTQALGEAHVELHRQRRDGHHGFAGRAV
jgi:transposase